MIDADKLDEIERETGERWVLRYYGSSDLQGCNIYAVRSGNTHGDLVAMLGPGVSTDEAERICEAHNATAREAIALRTLIDAHNAALVAECGDAEVPGKPYRACTGGKVLHYAEKCSNCLRSYMIDVPAGDAVAKEPICR